MRADGVDIGRAVPSPKSLLQRLIEACAPDGTLDERTGRRIVDEYVAERSGGHMTRYVAYSDCRKCHGTGTHAYRDPSSDGHGGLNGGAWVREQCPECYRRWMRDRGGTRR